MGRRISVASYDVLWESVMRDRPKPVVLRSESPGRTAQERGSIVREATAQLGEAGYLGPRGDPLDDVRQVLDTLDSPRLAVDVRLFKRDSRPGADGQATERWAARIAVNGTRAAKAILGPMTFETWSFPNTSVIAQVADLFGHLDPPKRFAGDYVFLDQLHGDAWARRRGRTEAALRQLAVPYLQRAHVTVAAMDPVLGGVRDSAYLVLNDTPAGRFLVFPATAPHQLAIAPGGRRRLETKLQEMIDSTSRN